MTHKVHSLKRHVLHRVALKTHYRDEPSGRQRITPEDHLIYGISFESEELREKVVDILMSHGFTFWWQAEIHHTDPDKRG